MKDLTILMPCLNEAKTIGLCISSARRWISSNGVDAAILIADNGSSDGSQEIARSNGASVICVSEKGYGSAIRAGSVFADSRYIIVGDSDCSYDFGDLDSFYDKLKSGYDLVVGNRFIGGIMPGAMPFKNRYIGNPVLTFIGKLLFRSNLGDFHCGLRGYSKAAFLKMGLLSSGMEFASEMIIRASSMKMKICEVPTILHKDMRDRPPHLRPWRDGWRHLRFMMWFSPDYLVVAPSLFLFLILFPIYCILSVSDLRLGDIRFSLNTMIIIGAFLLVSYVCLLLGILLKRYAEEVLRFQTNRRLNFLVHLVNFEIGLILSCGLIFSSFALLLDAAILWRNTGFAQVSSLNVTRQVFNSALLLVSGCFTVVFSFLAGLINLGGLRR